MRHLYTILLLIALSTLSASAQRLRLGERMPDISVASEYGSKLEFIEQELACLIFINSYCEPCIASLAEVDRTLLNTMEIVLLTTESREDYNDIIERIGTTDFAIAYDIESKTHKAFGINYIPFAVIYSTKRKIVEWFGPVELLNSLKKEQIAARL